MISRLKLNLKFENRKHLCSRELFFQIDLMENIKRSTSRDFRISAASLEAALHELSEEDENSDETIVEEENEPSEVS